MDKELFIKFHKSVKKMELFGARVQLYDNIELIAEMLAMTVQELKDDDGYRVKYFAYEGVKYFELIWEG